MLNNHNFFTFLWNIPKFKYYEDIENADIMNNNNSFVMNIEYTDANFSRKNITDDVNDEVFNTNYVDSSLALATNYSKSLNDIRMTHEGILMRPNSLAICIDDNFLYTNNKCFVDDVSSRRKHIKDVCKKKISSSR